MTDILGDIDQLTNTTKMIETQQMRVYDELRELDIEETQESLRYPLCKTNMQVMMKMFRSFLVFPLSLNIPGKGLFRKLIGENKTYRPVYNQTETGELIFYKGKIF